MDRNEDNIPYSALYTAATWRWGRVPCAELTTPEGASRVFSIVNAYMVLYRLLNPKKFSLQHTLLHRHTAIDALLERAQCPQIIEIAAGFSPRGSRYSADPACRYYDVDLPDVVALKRKQLGLSEAGQSVLRRPNLQLVAGDITCLDMTAFAAQKTFVITEGIMMYFDRQTQMEIWKKLADFIRQNGGEYVFDYIPLDDEPPRSWLGSLLSRARDRILGNPSTYAYDERGRMDVVRDLQAAGFSQVEALDSGVIAPRWGLPHADVKTRVIVYHCRC